ncbi:MULTISPECIES: acetylxylan esterase [unclassified Crossiella]|uniref:acetylxylan esterase n=1 Tax=unclassified Crossiella TaxID=2620835 RepID=UPI0020001165|nr:MULTISPECIES: acetylxylan esterase [unclassified Crossiella]MCK2241442.1 acetylxylan esterase [Crossiella sp. S99.2]MCK2255686.1 acetylxylan esterase [Crossiella sp. S99.1]
MLTDLDRPQLLAYRSDYTAPADFDAFWHNTLREARTHDLAVRLDPVATHLRTVEVFDVTFAGFGGHPIRGWLRLPRRRTGRLPAIVQFHGYGSGRGHPLDDLVWSAAGCAHLIMDARGQGGDHAGGATADPVGSAPSYPGFLTRGIEDEHDYVYRRIFTDAVRAVDTVRSLDFVDPRRVAVVGNSQGGGIALATAGLLPDLTALFAQAPFLTDIQRALRITGTAPYREITGYLAARRHSADRVFRTLGYFDGIAFAARANAAAWFATGLCDDICPPSTAFGAYHVYRGPKQIQVWDHNGHEAGGAADLAIALAGFDPLLRPSTMEEQ